MSRFSLYYSFLIPLPSRRHKTVLFFMQMIDRTIITTLTAEDLRDLVAEAVEHALQSFPKTTPTAQMEDAPFIDKKEAARLIGCCSSTIDNAARAGRLTRYYVGKSVRFDRTQVLALAIESL